VSQFKLLETFQVIAEHTNLYSAARNDSGEVDAFKAESDANEMPQKRRSARYAQANARSIISFRICC